METKICSKCKKEKPVSEFGKNKAKKDGLQAECKECKSAYNKLHYQKNAESLNPAFDLLRSIPFADTVKSVLGKNQIESKTTEFEEVK